MRLQTATDYALRTLIYTGVHVPELVTVGEVADAYGISRNHIMKIVQQLTNAGYLATERGRHGGMTLAHPAHEISVGGVVRAWEDDKGLAACFRDPSECCISDVCVLQRAFGQAREAFLATLDKYSLADLLGPRAALAKRLSLSPGTVDG